MRIKFGQFLINKKKITEEQLKKALTIQVEEHCKIGDITYFAGRMKEKQVDATLIAMTDGKNADKKFGEVAVELGYLSPNDVDEIMEVEEAINIRIGKILVLSGNITQDECDKYSKEFESA
ncbi:MAG: hypothetical protein ACUZ8E_02635 [Candidatus Anammoxibacter sp.]